MKAILATNDFSSYFTDIFSEVEVYNYKFYLNNHKVIHGDILIFTGGEDINPRFYGENPKGCHFWNDNRDSTESTIWDMYRAGLIKVKKVLGICRGIQILNVMLGGTLIQDLPSIGKSHKGIHNIEWQPVVSELFANITIVNSFHHQAIKHIGESARYTVLGKEPNTSVIEAISWYDRRGAGKGDNILGVQFHPEFFAKPERENFFSSIEKWIDGESLTIDPLKKNREKKDIGVDFSTHTASPFSGTIRYTDISSSVGEDE